MCPVRSSGIQLRMGDNQIGVVKDMQDKSLSRLVVRGGVWSFLLKISQIFLQVIKLIILARVLDPHTFGLFGIALLFTMALETLSQTGFDLALIHKKDNIGTFLDVSWTVAVVRGFVLFSTIYLSAPFVAVFFNVPEALSMMRVIGILPIIQGFNNIGIIYFRKDIEFRKDFFYQMSGILTSFIITLILVVTFKNVWALIFGNLVGGIVRLISGYIIHPFRPRFCLATTKIKELFSYGKWVFATGIMVFLVNSGDDIFVGRVLGVTVLGFYQMAYRISQLPSTEFVKVISAVTFPAYAKLQKNSSKLKKAFLRILNIVAFFAILFSGGIFVFSSDLVNFILTEKWKPIIPIIKLLAFAGLFRALLGTGGPLFMGVGKPKIDFRMNRMRLFVMAICIYPLTILWGVPGTALTIVIANLSCFYIWGKETKSLLLLTGREYVRIIIPPIVAVIMSSMLIIICRWFLPDNLTVFMFLVTVFTSTFIAVTFFLSRALSNDLFKDLSLILHTIRRKL
ncbi:MAG: lipopolysaccharide biosynthesis protein [Candidatus Omnitrophica bacterium]|nr:lipopolysaccharide biosynthesis protein [Candidatus Omnitrophota bacterium]